VPEPGVTVQYGRYLAHNCTLCHGQDLAGVSGEGGGLNLTPGGDLANWTQGDFIKVMRTGITPDSDNLDPELMPWQSLRKLTDDEIKAIWLYLQSLPPIENLETKAAREAR
jgi:mono/diheme cytochrome c family protein